MQTNSATAVRGPNFRSLYRNLGLSAVAPLIAIQWMIHQGCSPILALAVAAIFPLIELAIEIVQTKKIGVIATVALIGIIIGFGLSFATGDALFALLKDSALTGIFGLVFLGSLLTGEPLIYRLNLDFAANDPAAKARNEALWERPPVRRVFRLMTLVWGVGLLCECATRVAVGLSLPLIAATQLSPAIQVVFIGSLLFWTVLFVKQLQRRAAAAGL